MPLDQRHGGTITFGNIINPDTDELIDEVLISLFRSPHSYTGEDSCEISCHGSEYILAQIVRLLLAQGCRMARPYFVLRSGLRELLKTKYVSPALARITPLSEP